MLLAYDFMKSSDSRVYEEEIINLYFRQLILLGSFYKVFEIDQTYINGERNMTHYFHLRFLEKTKMSFGKKFVPGFEDSNLLGVFIEPERTKIEYRQDCSLGDKIKVRIYPGDTSRSLRFEFIKLKGGAILARGEQQIKNSYDHVEIEPTKPSRNIFYRNFFASKGIFNHLKEMEGGFKRRLSAFFFLLKASRKIKNGRYLSSLGINFSHTNITNKVRVSKYPEMFGDVREAFAQDSLFRFREEVGRKYLLKTIDAEYKYFQPLYFGDKVSFRARVTGVNKRFFYISVEYLSNGRVAAEATQRIGYTDATNHIKSLPLSLKSLLTAFQLLGG